MRLKVFPAGYWIQLLTLLTFVICCFLLAFAQPDIVSNIEILGLIILCILMLFYLLYVFIRRRDYFSYVTLTQNGISVDFMGREWFQADWETIRYVGEFRMQYLGIEFQARGWFYLSQEPITLNKTTLKFSVPHNDSINGKGVFISDSPKIRSEILKYVSEGIIEKRGYYIYGIKHSN